ncbi:DUF2306 domain-containing protein [Mangrovihabitans endophyticus]|uniref:Membrane protein n=1 Tax=Mangrovihabitans endophyticus TaxID=1751298 RepID=A0A8J3BVP0_9ACTN|nr:DUF2306 domain-containing protein [Mangrovihabitans endophyticus]GGK73581.1 membrane protein [Mangrovihabitans endophyticus]
MTTKAKNRDGLILAGLLTLSLVPAVAGSLRLTEFSGGPAVLSDHDRLASEAVVVAVHIVSAVVFSVAGAFQFAPGLRRRHRARHRRAGRVVAPAGVITALSGMWLAFTPAAITGGALAAIRLVVGAAMTVFLVLGVVAIRRRDFVHHRAWMIRGYALGVGAGTQLFTHVAWLLAVGPVTPSTRTLTMAAAWAINVATAEWIIRRAPGGAGRQHAMPTKRPRNIRQASM